MMAFLNRFVNYFVHPKLKEDKSLYEKSRISVITFLIIYFITIIYVLFYLLLSDGVYFNFKSILNYIDILATSVGLLLIKKTGKINTALSFMAFIYLYLITASIYVSGGINSYDVFWLIVLSTASFMFITIKTGFFMTIFSLLSVTFFYVVEEFKLTQFQTTPASLTLTYKYFNLSLILCMLTSMVYVLTRGNKKLQEALQLSKEQKIREEISLDFYDQIANKLSSLRHLAELVNEDEKNEAQHLSRIDANAKEVYDNFRDFIWTLDAKSDHVQELFMYLRDFADDCFKFSDVNLYMDSTPELLPDVILPSRLSKDIVPVFKEALTNIYKHAKAKNIHLNFILLENKLIIKLEDDGVGIDNSIIRKGNGLRNMTSRAEKTGGHLEINSTLFKGTQLIYTIKLLPTKGSALI